MGNKKQTSRRGSISRSNRAKSASSYNPSSSKPLSFQGANHVGSQYIDGMRREYSFYIMQMRAIVSVADGLKSSGRRLLYTARDGAAIKTYNLAAATMPLHPHAAPDDAACTLAAPFVNNIPLLQGIGNFGTYLYPKEYGATRYTDVKLSSFTKDVLFTDIDIAPMVPNYDMSREEPAHFLPLVPVSLLNPSEGLIIGYSMSILPRHLPDIIDQQINYLKGKRVKDVDPYIAPLNQRPTRCPTSGRWIFTGSFVRTSSTTIKITMLPYGQTFGDFEKLLLSLLESQSIVSFTDHSNATLDIDIVFKRSVLADMDDDDIMKMFDLCQKVSERIAMVSTETKGTLLEFSSTKDVITTFTDWRLNWFVSRYQHLKDRVSKDLQYVNDYIRTIESTVPSRLSSFKDKAALESELISIGVVCVDQIARLPAYSFTKSEYVAKLAKRRELESVIQMCDTMISDEDKRRDQYVTELQDILANFKRGKYDTIV